MSNAQQHEFQPLRNGIGNVLGGLIVHSQDRLTDDDLRAISSLSVLAVSRVQQLAGISKHLAALVCFDSEVGAFEQQADLADLLWFFSGVAEDIHACLEAANSADILLRTRRVSAEDQASSGSSKRSQKKRGA